MGYWNKVKQRFRYSVCDQFKPDVIEMGEIEKYQILSIFDQFPWESLLAKMKGKSEDEIHYSPSLEIENLDTKEGITISAVGEESQYEFYVLVYVVEWNEITKDEREERND